MKNIFTQFMIDEHSTATEGFMDRFKKNKSKPQTMIMQEFESKVKALVSKCIAKGKPIIAKYPQIKKGFSAATAHLVTAGDRNTIAIWDWDLWHCYKDARSRFENGDVDEFNSLYAELSELARGIFEDAGIFSAFTIDDNGDWNSGTIEVVPSNLTLKSYTGLGEL